MSGLLGALAGAGQGAIDKSQRMRQDTLRQEDNAMWEVRQKRLQEIGIEQAKAKQGIADQSESTRYSRNKADAETLRAQETAQGDKRLASDRAYAEGQSETKHMRELATKGVETSLGMLRDKNKMETAVSLGGGKAGGSSGLAATNAYKQYRELRAMDMPHDKALAISYNTIKSIKDEFGMTTGMVDIASDQLIGMIEQGDGGKVKFKGTEGWTGKKEPEKRRAPQIDEVVNGYRFKGGSPNDIDNWDPIK